MGTDIPSSGRDWRRIAYRISAVLGIACVVLCVIVLALKWESTDNGKVFDSALLLAVCLGLATSWLRE